MGCAQAQGAVPKPTDSPLLCCLRWECFFGHVSGGLWSQAVETACSILSATIPQALMGTWRRPVH
jgi:hypothetical protein